MGVPENSGKTTAKTKRGTASVEDRVKELETRLNNLLGGKTELQVELEIKDVQGLTVAPRSKLRVACE
jgi:hypothetical protein